MNLRAIHRMNSLFAKTGWLLLAVTAWSLASDALADSRPGQEPVEALRVYLEKAVTGLPGRVEVAVGALDARLQLAPCARVEPYVPAGTRLWGRSQIGLRCMEGATWNVFLPVDIKVFGPALVATRQIGYGQNTAKEDARLAEVDLTREAGSALTDPAMLDGKTAARAMLAGQVLRADYFRAQPAVGAGDSVRLTYNGNGFSVSASGRALGSANDGQLVRVQTDSGQVVQGTARPGRLVEMRL